VDGIGVETALTLPESLLLMRAGKERERGPGSGRQAAQSKGAGRLFCCLWSRLDWRESVWNLAS